MQGTGMPMQSYESPQEAPREKWPDPQAGPEHWAHAFIYKLLFFSVLSILAGKPDSVNPSSTTALSRKLQSKHIILAAMKCTSHIYYKGWLK